MSTARQYLLRAWYMAAWSSELDKDLLPRRICNTPVVLFRKKDGDIAALADRCPHRFAPLSKGERRGESITCGYHGLTFDANGQCIHNPFASAIPKGAQIAAYEVVERDGIAWIWLDTTSHADPSLIPDFSMLDRPCGRPLEGYTLMRAGYEFATDNLMDLSHIEFVHKGSFAGAGAIFAGTHDIKEDGATLHSNWWMPGVKAPAHTMGIYDPEMITDHWLDMRWNAPALMYLEVGATPQGGERSAGVVVHQAHIITPETESTAHYFWASTRPLDQVIPEADAAMQALFAQAFNDEDKPMIEAAFANLDGQDFWDAKPAFLGIDAGGTRARRKLQQLMQNESASSGDL